MSAYRWLLIASFAIVWVWAAIDPLYPADWLLENYLVFIFVPIVLLTGRYFRLSDLSYTFITLFLMMHVLGSHYTYAETPFGNTLQDWFGANRNMYDRFVHFGFGLLLAYPMREVFLRVAKTTGVWGYLLPLVMVIALSTVYELIEWSVARQVDLAAGIAFLGAQGDVWDAQKDILAAIVGASITLVLVAIFNWRYDENFWWDMRNSLQIPGDDRPLGEIKMRELVDKRNKKRNLIR